MKIFLCEAIHQNAYDELKKYGIIIDDFNQIQECEVLINRNLRRDFLNFPYFTGFPAP